jgi:hypothetical protein
MNLFFVFISNNCRKFMTSVSKLVCELFDSSRNQVISMLSSIGKQHTDALMQLSAIAQPMIPAEQRVPVLKAMFDDLPGFFHSRTEQELFLILKTGQSSLLSLDHLRSLRQVWMNFDFFFARSHFLNRSF